MAAIMRLALQIINTCSVGWGRLSSARRAVSASLWTVSIRQLCISNGQRLERGQHAGGSLSCPTGADPVEDQ